LRIRLLLRIWLLLIQPWAQFCCKMWGSAWCETNIVLGRCRSDVLYIRIPNLISRGVLRATLTTLCFVLADDLHINILKFVAGHGIIVQPVSINIVFGCKQAQQYSRTHYLSFIRTDRWSAQNAKLHWSHVHITFTVKHFRFRAFDKKCGLQPELGSSELL